MLYIFVHGGTVAMRRADLCKVKIASPCCTAVSRAGGAYAVVGSAQAVVGGRIKVIVSLVPIANNVLIADDVVGIVSLKGTVRHFPQGI